MNKYVKMSSAEHEKFIRYLKDCQEGSVLSGDTLLSICETCDYDPEAIGRYFLELLPHFYPDANFPAGKPMERLEPAPTANAYLSSIAELQLTVRAFNALYRASIRTILDLTQLTYEELCEIPGMGTSSLKSVVTQMGKCGFSLRKEKQNLNT